MAGFTLVEMIVATALFSVVMLVSVSALLSLVNANRKAQALQSVMNNLNITLDSMVRSARMGSDYSCGGVTYTAPSNCPSGESLLAFKPFGSIATTPPVIYRLNSARIEKSVTGTLSGMVPITAPEVTIDSLMFYVVGTAKNDTTQPKIVIVVKGSAGAPGSTARTTFHIQSTAVQRVLDI